MYQYHIIGHHLFENRIQSYGNDIDTFYATDKGETPASLVNASIGSCMLMCVQGYLHR